LYVFSFLNFLAAAAFKRRWALFGSSMTFLPNPGGGRGDMHEPHELPRSGWSSEEYLFMIHLSLFIFFPFSYSLNYIYHCQYFPKSLPKEFSRNGFQFALLTSSKQEFQYFVVESNAFKPQFSISGGGATISFFP